MNKKIGKDRLRKELAKKNGISIVQFRIEWSGACQIISPVFDELARSYNGSVAFYSIDAEKENGAAQEFGVVEFPTILFFKNGELIDHAKGLIPKNVLINKIEKAISQTI